ncbi:MAG: DUF58 domain-containing protein [Thermoguttaceae bacterium]|nr:DUF58 domain-containing protein [Thermoguttaceae bacterium]
MRVFSPSFLASLGDFRLRVKRLASGVTFGEHASVRQGVSTEFHDRRAWEQGDEPKFTDWRLFARTGKLFTRQYKEETTTSFYFLIDFSPSMTYAGIPRNDEEKRLSKLEYAQCVTAVLAYIALQQRDLVGICATNGAETVPLRPSTGESHWSECVRFLESPPFTSKTSSEARPFEQTLNDLAAMITRRGKIFILSDFFDVQSWDSIVPQLKLLIAQGNELELFQILDADELDFPFDSRSEFVPLEGSTRGLTLTPDVVRDAYLTQFQDWRNDLLAGCRALDVEIHLVDTRQRIDETVKLI